MIVEKRDENTYTRWDLSKYTAYCIARTKVLVDSNFKDYEFEFECPDIVKEYNHPLLGARYRDSEGQYYTIVVIRKIWWGGYYYRAIFKSDTGKDKFVIISNVNSIAPKVIDGFEEFLSGYEKM